MIESSLNPTPDFRALSNPDVAVCGPRLNKWMFREVEASYVSCFISSSDWKFAAYLGPR